MNRQPVIKPILSPQTDEYFIKEDFIKILNALIDSIKNYQKVSRNLISNKKVISNKIERKLNILKDDLNKTTLNKELLNELNQQFLEYSDILKKNNFFLDSSEANLTNFFDDAKQIFRVIREIQQNYIQIKSKNYSQSKKKKSGILIRENNTDFASIQRNKSTRMETNHSTGSKKIDYNIDKAWKNKINKNTIDKEYNNIHSLTTCDINNDHDERYIEQIKILKNNVLQHNLKYKNLKNNYNKILNMFKNLKEENIRLKQRNNIHILDSYSNIINTKNNSSSIINMKNINKDINFFKTNIETQKKNSNYFINREQDLFLKNSQVTPIKSESEITTLKKTIIIKDNKIKELIKKNKELFINLSKYQKDILNKSKELENLKSSCSGTEQMVLSNAEEYMSQKQKIEDLEKEKKTLENKVKYFQSKMLTMKNENIQKVKENVKLKNDLKKNNNDLKIYYEKQLNEYINAKEEMGKNLDESKNYNRELIKQNNDLNQLMITKDIKCDELTQKVEDYRKNLLKMEKEKEKLVQIIHSYESKKVDKNNDINNILKLNESLEKQKIINNDLNDELKKIKNDNQILEKKVLLYENNVNGKDINTKLLSDIEELKKENLTLKNNNEKLKQQLNGNNNIINENNVVKIDEEEFKALKRENEKIKEQLIRLSTSLPKEYNDLQKQYNVLESKYKNLLNNTNVNGNIDFSPKKVGKNNKIGDKKEEVKHDETNLKKEIETLKKKNDELFKQLEEKELKNYDNRSEENISNYEEEFDLRKMAKGAKEKNRSQDINIDYPGIQSFKEKYRELDFYYNSMEGLVKKLLVNIQCNAKNKVYVTELCKMVGFNLDITNKIVNNKNKKLLLSLFNK